ncbi:hypothetical protein [Kitasatospora sp. NPDC002040]|uniref:hypothetical protein n=1 Tax=Kitasatospora sp. NPDC002040 TaxID=3154661 RepID=UPI00331D0AA0
MRLRQAAVTTVGVFALLLSTPLPANAAAGDFLYRTGAGAKSGIADPKSGVCIDLEGATEDSPAHSPENFTDSTATVFLESECNGDTYYVMKPGKRLGTKLKLRSVIFS